MEIKKSIIEEKQGGESWGIIARGGIMILIGSFVSILANFAYQFFLARWLGPADVGLVNLGISIITLVSLVVVFGLDRAVVRYITFYIGANNRSREIGVTASALQILCITTLVLVPTFLFSTNYLANQVFHEPSLARVLSILGLGLPSIVLTRLFLCISQAYKQMKPILVIEQITVPILRVISLGLLIFIMGSTSSSAASSFTLAAFLGCIPAIYLGNRIYQNRRAGIQIHLVTKEVFQFAWLTMLSIMLNRTNTQTETLLLGVFSTMEQVGIYTVGLKATVFISIFLDAIATVFTPFIAELYAKRELVQLAIQLKTITRWAFTLALPIGIILFVGSPDIMAILGPGFKPGVQVLKILVVAQIAYVMLGPGGLLLVMTDYNRLNLFNAILNLFLSIILDIILIPIYGAYGAAIAGAVTIMFVNLVRLIEVYRVLGIHPYNASFIKPAIAGLGALTAGFVINSMEINHIWRLIILCSTVFPVYCGLVLLFKLDNKDRELYTLLFRSTTKQ